MILNCSVLINVRNSPDRSLHRQLTQKVTWYLSCSVLSLKKIPAASSGEVSLLPYGQSNPLAVWRRGLTCFWQNICAKKKASSLIITLRYLQGCLYK